MIGWMAAALGLALTAQATPSPSPAPRQESLAEKAERARRPAPAGSPAAPAKVFTNDDLVNARGTVIVLPAPADEPAAEPAPGAEAAEGGTSTSTPQATEEVQRARAGAELQKQIDDQVQTINIARAAIADWEREMGDLTNYTFGSRRETIMQNIEDARKAVADAQRSLADLEDQARRQGVRVTLP
jgi:hypothetical protein